MPESSSDRFPRSCARHSVVYATERRRKYNEQSPSWERSDRQRNETKRLHPPGRASGLAVGETVILLTLALHPHRHAW